MGRIITIWGTGQEAAKLMKWLSEVNCIAEEIIGEKACDVAWFLDSNIEKTRQPFYDREVKLAQAAWHDKQYPIVVAVAKNEEIVSMLEQHGYRKMESYLTLKEFYSWFWQETRLPWTLIEVIGIRDYDFLVGMQERILPYDMPDRFVRLRQALKIACEQRGRADWLMSLQDMLVSSILWADCDWPDKQAMGQQLLDMVGIAKFVDWLEIVFKENVASAAAWMPLAPKTTKYACPETIAIYYMRYYNGGIERVLSKLLQLFHTHGYRVVLFTDEIREDMEYPLPDGVVRVQLGYEGGRRERCERLLQGLQFHHVNVFCSHARGSNTFYDLFCVQQVGIPVVLELHNNFSYIENLLDGNLLSTGRRIDAVVTLSRVDAMFWHLLGCHSIYVPNPVEPPEEKETQPAPYTILWLQRIDQVQKQVLELPAILEYVVQALPEARLQIVGAADKPDIEACLRQMFEERGLTENVDFMGFHTDVAKFYRQATVMLMTSRFEGFPMTIAESKRYGTPLVMYELPYLELLRDGRGYIAVPQHDQRGAAKALLRVLSDRKLRRRLSQEAKASLEAFSKVNLMEEWEKVFVIAGNIKPVIALSEEEKTFSEVEQLLLQFAERMRDESLENKRR